MFPGDVKRGSKSEMSSPQTTSRRTRENKRQTQKRACLLILGMHRSGTSAMTRVTSLLGADLPQTLLDGTGANLASNPKGHWESEPLVRLNDEILTSAGISWRSPEAVSDEWYRSPRFEQFRDRAQTVVENEYGNSPLFVFKDPRLCKLVPFWLSVMAQAGIEPAIINMVRHPEEVAASLLTRNALDRPLGVVMWLRYVLGAERATRAQPRVHVSYDGLLADWQRSARSISDTFDIRWPSASTERGAQINQFLSDADRHHRVAPAVDARDDVRSWAFETYEILDKWVQNGESLSDYPRLDEIAERFEGVLVPLLEPVLVSFEKSASVQKLQTIRAAQNRDLQLHGEHFRRLYDQLLALAKDIEFSLEGTAEYTPEGAGEQVAQLLAALSTAIRSQRRTAARELASVNAALLTVRGRQEAVTLELARSREERRSVQNQLDIAKEEIARAKEKSARVKRDGEERVRALDGQLKAALKLAASRAATIANLRDDRSQKTAQRDALQSAIEAMRSANTLRVQERDARIQQLSESLQQRDSRMRELKASLQERDVSMRQIKESVQDRDLRIRQLKESLGEREDDIRELKRSVKRLENKIDAIREAARQREGELTRQIETEAQAKAAAAFIPAQAPAVVPTVLRSLVPAIGRQQFLKDAELVRDSGLFDAEFYGERYPDLEGGPEDLLKHYILYGGREGRAPSAAFDGSRYLKRYPDVEAAGLNPLVHYLQAGRAQSRSTFPASIPKAVESARASREQTDLQIRSDPGSQLDRRHVQR